MRWPRSFTHGVADLRAHPWRAVLSGVSLCIGVLAVVSIFTVSTIIAEVFIAVEEQRNGRLVTASGAVAYGGDLDSNAVRSSLNTARQFVGDDGAIALVARPSFATSVSTLAQERAGAPMKLQPITFVAGDLTDIRRLPVLDGRWLRPADDLPLEVVANLAGAHRWGGVGTRLALRPSADQGPVPGVIVGVVADGTGDASLYTSLTATLYLRPSALENASLEILVHHPSWTLEKMSSVAAATAAAGGGRLLDQRLHRRDTVANLLDQLNSLRRAFLAIAILALVISALGMLNIGLASLGERARELVIRRALGATAGDIVNQMLVSAASVGVMAGVTAIVLVTIGVQVWVPTQIPPTSAISLPTIPWEAVMWGLTASILTTIAGSLIPAVLAARLDVANALRD